MSQLNATIKELAPFLKGNENFSENRIEDIIKHSFTSAIAGLAGGFLPGVAAVIAVLTSSGAIWTMYYRLCKELNINISQNILKTVGSAVLTNIVTQLGGVLVVELVARFIPGVAVIASAAACYGVTYLAGYLFITVLVKLFKAGKNPASLTADELSSAGRAVSQESDCKGIFKNATREAKEKIRSGEISKKG